MIFGVTIMGQPIGKGRPIASSHGGHVRMRTPQKTASWEWGAALLIRGAWLRPALDEPVKVTIAAVMRRPAARPKHITPADWKAGDQVPCISKPDLDNIGKVVLDALVLAGVLKDDTRVCWLACSKMYASAGQEPSVVVTVATVSALK